MQFGVNHGRENHVTDMWKVFDCIVLLALLILTPMGEGEVAAVRMCTWIIHTILTYLKMLMAVRV